MPPATITLYRAEPFSEALLHAGRLTPKQSVRLPSNLPYVVDNLWEVLRPADMPSRRHALYASPTPELAKANCSARESGEGFCVYELKIDGAHSITQIPQKDARDHPDKKNIAKLIQKEQARIANAPMTEKPWIALLFMPGATKHDWDVACQESKTANWLVDEMQAMSTFWKDAGTPVADKDGELFIQLHEGAGYQALRLQRYRQT